MPPNSYQSTYFTHGRWKSPATTVLYSTMIPNEKETQLHPLNTVHTCTLHTSTADVNKSRLVTSIRHKPRTAEWNQKWQSMLMYRSPRLARSLLLSTTDYVCLSVCVCHAPSNCFFFFVSLWNRAIIWPSVLHVALYKTVFFYFDLGPLTPKIYSPKFSSVGYWVSHSRYHWVTETEDASMAPLWRHNVAPIVDDCSTSYMPQ